MPKVKLKLRIVSLRGIKEMIFEAEGTLEEIKKLQDDFNGASI